MWNDAMFKALEEDQKKLDAIIAEDESVEPMVTYGEWEERRANAKASG